MIRGGETAKMIGSAIIGIEWIAILAVIILIFLLAGLAILRFMLRWELKKALQRQK